MSVTVLELLNIVLERLGQQPVVNLSALSVPARQALLFLNDTYMELLETLGTSRLQKTGQFTSQPNIAHYSLENEALPVLLISETLIHKGERTPLTEVPPEQVNRFNPDQAGRPGFYWKTDSQIALWPVPDKNYTFTYRLAPQPEGLTATTPALTGLTPAMQRALLWGAQAYLAQFLGEASATDAFALYQQALTRLKAAETRNPKRRIQSGYRGARQK